MQKDEKYMSKSTNSSVQKFKNILQNNLWVNEETVISKLESLS